MRHHASVYFETSSPNDRANAEEHQCRSVRGMTRLVRHVWLAVALLFCLPGCSRKTDRPSGREARLDAGDWQVSRELIRVSRPWEAPAFNTPPDQSSHSDPHQHPVLPAGSIGTDACVSCHKEQAASYFATTHSRAGRPVEQSQMKIDQAWHDERIGRRFEVICSDAAIEHRELIQLNEAITIAQQSASLEFEFGSGTHAHTYLFRDGSFACESPLTWYSEDNQWDLSPGYDPLKRPSFDRQITSGCVYCHAGRVQIYNENPNHFRILESSIGCERCHGPGAEHVARYQGRDELNLESTFSHQAEPATGLADPPKNFNDTDQVINPASLGRIDSEAICAQCHLQGAVFVVGQGRGLWDYRPGQRLSEIRTDFQSRETSDEFRIVGHTEQMHASQCYQQSSTLTCITCHDPHRHGTTSDLKADYQSACQTCHSDESCHIEPAVRLKKAGNDCSTCHMPQRPTNVTHAALHDHRIAVHADSFELAGLSVPADRFAASDIEAGSTEPVLFSILNSPGLTDKEKDRRWALATHHLFFNDRQKDAIARDMKRAQSVLLRLNREGNSDPDCDVALARDYFDAGMIGTAEQLAGAVLQQEIGQSDAVINATDILARIAMQRQENAVALDRYEQLTRMRRVAGDHFLMGICLINAGRTQESIAALLQSLRIDPLLELAHEQLVVLFDHHNENARADSHRKALREIQFHHRSYPMTTP